MESDSAMATREGEMDSVEKAARAIAEHYCEDPDEMDHEPPPGLEHKKLERWRRYVSIAVAVLDATSAGTNAAYAPDGFTLMPDEITPGMIKAARDAYAYTEDDGGYVTLSESDVERIYAALKQSAESET